MISKIVGFIKNVIGNQLSVIGNQCELPITDHRSPVWFFNYVLYKTVMLNIIMFCSTLPSFPQESQFSQYYSFPLYLNPALTGMIYHDRTSFIYRQQWMGLPDAYRTYGFSYDKNWVKKKSGIGLVMVQDQTSGGAFATLTAGGLYSYHLQVSRTKLISSGFRISYFQQKLVPEKLSFADQLIRNDGSSTVEIFENRNHAFADMAWGMLFNSFDSLLDIGYWTGFSLDHLNAPPISFSGTNGRQPVKFSLHGGVKYRLTKDVKDKTKSMLSFNFLYKAERKWDQAEAGVSYSYHDFNVGLAYRGIPFLKRYKPGYLNHDAVIILLGYNKNDLQIGYAFDFTISKLGVANTLGSHELSLVHKFYIPPSKKSRYKKKAKMATPKF